MNTNLPDTKLYKIGEIAKILSVSIGTLRRWERQGKITSTRTAGGHRRYNLEAVRAIKTKKEIGAVRPAPVYTPSASIQTPVAPKEIQVPVIKAQPINFPFRKILKAGLLVLILYGLLFTVSKTHFLNKIVAYLPESIKTRVESVIGKDEEFGISEVNTSPSVLAESVSKDLSFDVSINANLLKDLSVGGNATVSGTLTTTGGLTTNGSLTSQSVTTGGITGTTGVFNGEVTTGVLTTGNITSNGTLTVAGTSKLTGDVTASGALSVSGSSTLSGATTVGSTLTVSGATTLSSLGVTGNATFGNITGVNGVTYSFPATQGVLNSVLTNDASGNLTWTSLAGAGGVTGTGVANQITYWSGTSTVTGNNNFTWNNSTSTFSVGGSTVLGGATTDLITFTGRVASGTSLIPAVNLGSDLGSSLLKWNNIYAANLNIDSGVTSSGQLLVTYNPADTTFAQSSIRVNVTTPSTDEQMLGIGQAGEERAAIDAEGDLTIGYDGAPGSSVPANSNPLAIYNHGTTELMTVLANGNVGIGITNPANILSITGSQPIIDFKDTGQNYHAYLGEVSAGYFQLAANRNPATGVFSDINEAASNISLVTGSNNSYIAFGTGATNNVSPTEAMRIDKSGNVGIGVTNPTSLLTLSPGTVAFTGAGTISTPTNNGTLTLNGGSTGSAGGVAIGFQRGGTGYMFFDAGATNNYVLRITPPGNSSIDGLQIQDGGVYTGNYLLIKTQNNTPILGLNSSGNLGVGTISPVSKLHLTGAVTGKALAIFDETGDQALFTASASGSPKFIIDHSGNVGIGTTSPTNAVLQVFGGEASGYASSYFGAAGWSTTNGAGLMVGKRTTSVSGKSVAIAGQEKVEGQTSINFAAGVFGEVAIFSAADPGEVYGIFGNAHGPGASGSYSNVAALGGEMTTGLAGSTTSNLYGLRIKDLVYGGNNVTLTNTYGAYIGDLTPAGTFTQTNTPYSFYASDANAWNYFAGNVGIGTTNPLNLLDISSASTSTASAMIRNTSTSAGIAGLAIKLSSTTLDNTSRFVNFLDLNGTIIGKIQAANTTSVNYAANGTDMAEYFTKDSSVFTPGDLVSQGSNGATLTTNPYDSKMIGIVSTAPSFTGGVEGPNKVLVALVGQVPVKISSASSPINPGDYITSSSEAGKAMKAINPGYTIGKALEGWDPSSGKTTINVYIHNSYFEGDLTAQIAKLQTDVVNLQTDLSLVKISSSSGTVATDSATFKDITVLGNSVLSDTVVNGKVNIGTMILDNINNSIDVPGTLKLQSLALGTIEFEGGNIVMDASGNVSMKKGHIAGNSSFRGSVVITAGSTSAVVTQTTPWDSIPVSITATANYNTNVWITNKTTNGFTVNVAATSTSDQTVDWLAIW